MPLVSVIMAVHNGALCLAESIASILNQTWHDLEFIIVDDGSSDATPMLLTEHASFDSRIRVLREPHRGLAASLNTALDVAGGEYIARMDADDVSRPDRIRKQVQFLDKHPEYGLCGTWVKTIGTHAGEIWRFPVHDAAIRSELVFNSPLAHPTVMLRRPVLQRAGGYNKDWSAVEDYELWVRLADHICFANLPDVLLNYRLHDRQKGAHDMISGKTRTEIRQIHRVYMDRLNVGHDCREMQVHEAVSIGQFQPDRDFVVRAGAWLNRLRAANGAGTVFPERAFLTTVANKWWATCYAARSLGIWTWQQFRQSPLRRAVDVSPQRMAHFALACLRHRSP